MEVNYFEIQWRTIDHKENWKILQSGNMRTDELPLVNGMATLRTAQDVLKLKLEQNGDIIEYRIIPVRVIIEKGTPCVD